MEIKYTKAFKRDYKRFKKKHYDVNKIYDAIDSIIENRHDDLSKLKDHSRTGDWIGFRELHLEPDWLLIYRLESNSLHLVITRLGTHDDLFKKRP